MFAARAGCTRVECPNAPIESCHVDDLNHCWIGGRSGGFNELGDCRRRPGDVDSSRRMFRFWSEATNATNPPDAAPW